MNQLLIQAFVDWCAFWYDETTTIAYRHVEEYVRDEGLNSEAKSDLFEFIRRAEELKAMKESTAKDLGVDPDNITWADE